MSTSAQPALRDLKSAMAAANDLFNTQVFGQRNFDALEQIYTRDARILPPGAPMISGRAAIKEFWSSRIQSMNGVSAVLESLDVLPAGEGAVEIGRGTITVQAGDATNQIEVKYVVYWRQEDGAWKWDVDIWNPNS